MTRFFSPYPLAHQSSLASGRPSALVSLETLEARRLLAASALTVNYSAAVTVPSLSLSDAIVTEGKRGSATFATITVTLSEASSQKVMIGYRTQGITAAAAGAARDFVPTSGTLTIKPGQTTGSIRVRILGDNRVEADEVLNVVITQVKNATPSNPFARVVIRDDDTANLTRPTLSVSNPTVLEGKTAAFVVFLSSPSSRDISVRYTTMPGTATNSRFSPTAGILTIKAGQTSGTIYVSTVDDGIVNPDQQFSLKLSTAANADIASDTGTATMIEGDIIPSISVADTFSSEGDLGLHMINFTVNLSSVSAQTVKVSYATVNGTALAGSDYTATSGTLTFAPGVTSLTVSVTLLNDTVYESPETFGLTLSSAINATITQGTAVGTIYDNDDPPTASIIGLAANEGSAGNRTPFTFVVTLSAASGTTGTVNYATSDGTALAGQDYEAASGTLTFAPGVTSQTITIYVIGNDLYENTKVVTVNLSNPVNLRLTAATAAANGSILNDDPSTPLVNVETETATV